MASPRPAPARRAAAVLLFTGTLAVAIGLNRHDRHPLPDLLHPGFALVDGTRTAGINFGHHRPSFDPQLANIEPHVAGLGASVSVADADADGWLDLYFTNSRFGMPNALYRNNGDGTFEDIAPEAGVAALNREGEGVSMGSIWGDVDNDGREDLLVYKYGFLQLFHNIDGRRFEDITAAAGLRRWMNSNGAVWLDYDRDGFLDLYVTAYFRSDIDFWNLRSTRIMHDSFEFSSNGGRNLLFRNLGDGRFEDVTDAVGGTVGSTRWTLAAAAADLNEDGWPDLYLANDYGPEELYLNREGRRFELARAGLEADSKSGMSVSLGDVYNLGRLDVFVTNISERGYLFLNNNLRLNLLREVGRLENIATGPVADAGWAWGAQFGDLNNDGNTDLVVVNGFISADRERNYWYAMSKIAGASGAVFEDARNWPAFGTMSLSGYERSLVLLNRGGEPWVDVAEAVGLTDTYDGRAVALADLDNHGGLDVVVANQNQPAVLYRNTPDPSHHWIAFQLVGSASNRSAIGAEVILAVGRTRQIQVLSGGMGFASQNDPRPHFGLGERDRVDSVTIRWPSGHVQVLRDPRIDRIHLVAEPPG